MPTILDVARQAGVGVGTVSRVLNDSPAVSDATRSRVRAVIEDLGYRPSSLARGLSRGTSTAIGALVPNVTQPSSMERLRGVLDTLAGTPYDLTLFQVDRAEDRERRLQDVSRPDRCAGGLLVSLRPSAEEIERISGDEALLVTVDGRIDGVPGCYIDNQTGGRIATEHLLERGHRRIAFVGDIADDPLGFGPGRDRLAGYRAALHEARLDYCGEYVKAAPHDRTNAIALAHELFTLEDPPTAIVTTSDIQALGVIAGVRARGARVPEDVSVIGFDDLEMASHFGLTTVRQPLYESGALGARMLLALLEGLQGEEVVEQRRLALEIVIRETTGPVGRSVWRADTRTR